MKNRILLIGFVMVFALIAANIGMAQTTTDTFNVTATVAEACTISAASDITFGAYDPSSAANVDAAGTITFNCVKGTVYDTYITGTRSMSSVTSGDSLTFQLYADAGRTTAFPAVNPSDPDTATSNAEAVTNVYGRIPGSQDVGAGNDYTVQLTATIEY